tara:strand:+ start:137 stop:436 length:300 start_codon:yes stop_codon:yes gene_type:complete
MALKFDGKFLKDGSKTLCNVRGNTIYPGTSANGALANVRGNIIYPKLSANGALVNVRGDKIYPRLSVNGALIKTSDAARKIGATSRGPLTAAIWYLFCR